MGKNKQRGLPSDPVAAQKILKQLFYEIGGKLINKRERSSKSRAGEVAGYRDARGYWIVGIRGKRYKLARLIFLWYHGHFPVNCQIVDKDKDNTHISNLKDVSREVCSRNKKKYITNTSGYAGVYKRRNGWFVSITTGGHFKTIGTYDTIEEAAAVRAELQARMGYSIRHGMELREKRE